MQPAAVPLALYVHLPWCVRKCPYCDFNSHQRPANLPEAEYVEALLADLDQDLPLVAGRSIHSIFFGGGTPSLFSGAAIARLLHGVRARLPIEADAEITLETNPGSAEFDRFEAYREAGVNRISFGVQSFDDEALRRLGRIHGADEARRAYALARAAGYDNINLDLMYALPAQTLQAALDDLDAALQLAPEHISHYHLTLEPDTVFAARPPADLPDEDLAIDMQERCQQKLADAGYAHYEVSAYARAGRRSQHNLNYWQFGDYLGIGAGAHGKISLDDGRLLRLAKQRTPRFYMDKVRDALRVQERREVAGADRCFEFMLNALRLIDGVPREFYRQRTGRDLDSEPGWQQACAKGLVEPDCAVIKTTTLGLRYLNDTLGCFQA